MGSVAWSGGKARGKRDDSKEVEGGGEGLRLEEKGVGVHVPAAGLQRNQAPSSDKGGHGGVLWDSLRPVERWRSMSEKKGDRVRDG